MAFLQSSNVVRLFILLFPLVVAAQAATVAEYPPRDNRPKRRPEMDTNGFYGDTFSSGFGDFYTAKKRRLDMDKFKRRPEMDTNGFYGDTFSSGFGDFYTARKRVLQPGRYNWRMDKRRPEMDTNGFYGDTFSSGFGDFYTAKRAPWEKSVDDKSPVRDLGGRLEA